MGLLRIFALMACLFLVGCASGSRQLQEPFVPFGDFQVGHIQVVAPTLRKGPLSRDASAEDWTEAVQSALRLRFDRFEGQKTVHLGVSLEGYVLARAGVPLVLSPKSLLVVQVSVIDDASGMLLGGAPKVIQTAESLTEETVVGSGLTLSVEEQMADLAANIALRIETWMRDEQTQTEWFGPEG